jgi:hypothetical protein
MLACNSGLGRAVKTLTQLATLNIQNIRGQTALHITIADDWRDVGGMSSKWFYDPSDVDLTDELPIKTKSEKFGIVQQLLIVETIMACKFDPNIQDIEGNTPFVLACSCNELETAQLLHSAGADIMKPTYTGVNALMAASVNGHIQISQWRSCILLGASNCNYLKHSVSTTLIFSHIIFSQKL